jgi:hypothetical protein
MDVALLRSGAISQERREKGIKEDKVHCRLVRQAVEYLKEVCTQSVAIRRGCLHPAQTLASQTQKRPALLLGSETNKS